ncbi:MAG: carbon storage regulator [Pirellulales bacterium]
MLVLTRRESERIRVGDSIVVTVVRVSGDRVRLGIEAPAHVRVLRDELQPHAAQADSRPASQSTEVPGGEPLILDHSAVVGPTVPTPNGPLRPRAEANSAS